MKARSLALSLLSLTLPASAQDFASVIVRGAVPSSEFGTGVARLGDVDGDGFDDFAVSSDIEDDTSFQQGAVRVISSRTGGELAMATGQDPAGYFGAALTSIEDVDGDGVREVAVGAFRQYVQGERRGRVHLLSGATLQTLYSLDGERALEDFGLAVAACPDVDGDGISELVVGARRWDGVGPQSGRVRLHSGATGALLQTWSGTASSFFGVRVAGLDDIDGDGLGDVAVASVDQALSLHHVDLYSGATGAHLRQLTGATTNDSFGLAIASAGDRDGDGRPDLWISASTDSTTAPLAGRLHLVSSATGSTLDSFDGPRADSRFGASIAVLDDVDGDGTLDLAVGMSHDAFSGEDAGAVQVVSGATGAVLLEEARSIEHDHFGTTVVAVGDVNGDGRSDFVVGSPGDDDLGMNAGAVHLYASRSPVGATPCASTANSTGAPAETVAVGSRVLFHRSVELVTTDAPPGTLGIYVVSDTAGFVAMAGGSQGNLCLGGAIGRYAVPSQIRTADATGRFALDVDLDALPQPTGSASVNVGDTWHWQAWFRDSVQGAATSNFSSSVAVTFD